MLLELVAAAGLVAAPVSTESPTWKIDVAHSEISFRVRHYVTRVPGTFKTFEGTIVADPADLAKGSVEVTIDAASIDTRNERRDNHLRSSDFFAVDSFPTITFKSTRVEASGDALTIHGTLTMRGVTKPIVLAGEFSGVAGTPEPGKQKIGFTASTRLNRLDYGLRWNRLVEGSNMLGDDVEITLNIEATRQ